MSIVGGLIMGLTFVLDLLVESPACRTTVWEWAPKFIGLGLLAGGLGSLVRQTISLSLQLNEFENQELTRNLCA